MAIDRISILQKYLRLILSENGHGTWGQEMDAELAKLKPRKEKLPDPISLGMTNGKWAGVTEQGMAQWSALFPGVDIPLELRKAAAWILGHPTRAKERWTPFLVRWLGRALRDLERKSPSQSTIDKWHQVEDDHRRR
jgi:hypothetical protein